MQVKVIQYSMSKQIVTLAENGCFHLSPLQWARIQAITACMNGEPPEHG